MTENLVLLSLLKTTIATPLLSEDVKEINTDSNNIYLSIPIHIFLRNLYITRGRLTHILIHTNLSNLHPSTKPQISQQNAL